MNAATLAARTPATRDRYVDLLRVVSIGVVVGGHWLMAVVTVGDGGAVRATNVLAVVPWLQWLTWLLQVMPVFFLVGGFSHAAVLRRRDGHATSYAAFVRSRAGRLLRPTAVFVAVWLALAVLIELAGRDQGVLRVAARTVAQPLWFIGVYLGIVALAPAMLRLHDRLRSRGVGGPVGGAVAVPVALAVAVVAVDVLRFAWHVPYVGYLNVALVWLAVHQAGFLYADGMLRRGGAPLVIGGLATALALTALGPYPVSMVGVPGQAVSNMSPPTLVLLAHAAWLIGLVLLVREPVSRWLHRPRVWLAVVVANGYAMTVFLWHLTALFALTAVTLHVGVDQPAAGSTAWWLTRPAWLAALALVTAGLVAAFRRADGPWLTSGALRSDGRKADLAAGVGVALAVLGVLGLSSVGFAGPLSGRTATLVAVPVSPLGSAAILAAGAALLWLSRRLPSAATQAPVVSRPTLPGLRELRGSQAHSSPPAVRAR
jgi:hypothetical protein